MRTRKWQLTTKTHLDRHRRRQERRRRRHACNTLAAQVMMTMTWKRRRAGARQLQQTPIDPDPFPARDASAPLRSAATLWPQVGQRPRCPRLGATTRRSRACHCASCRLSLPARLCQPLRQPPALPPLRRRVLTWRRRRVELGMSMSGTGSPTCPAVPRQTVARVPSRAATRRRVARSQQQQAVTMGGMSGSGAANACWIGFSS